MKLSRTPTLVLVSAVLVCLISSAAAAADKKPAWKPLFDGKTLKGWHPVGDGSWAVEKGVIVGRANNEKLYGLLVSDAVFKDFTVRLKFKCHTGDSGFYIRTVIKKPEKAHGLQVQCGPAGSGTGGIYESHGRAWINGKSPAEKEKKYYKEKGWNEMTITAKGGSVVVQVNGAKADELKNDPGRPEGHFALQMHAGCKMEVFFKDIEILKK